MFLVLAIGLILWWILKKRGISSFSRKYTFTMGLLIILISIISVIPISTFKSSSPRHFCVIICEYSLPFSYPIAITNCIKDSCPASYYHEIFLKLFENKVLIDGEMLFLYITPTTTLLDMILMRFSLFLIILAFNSLIMLFVASVLILLRCLNKYLSAIDK